LQPCVRLEDAPTLGLGHARPVVLHKDLDALAASLRTKPDHLAGIAVLDRVVHEIHERLPDESAVARHGKPSLAGHLGRLPCIVHGKPNRLDDIIEQFVHGDRPQRRRELERARTREQQHVVHDPDETAGLPYDRAGQRHAFGIGALALHGERLAGDEDLREGHPEIV